MALKILVLSLILLAGCVDPGKPPMPVARPMFAPLATNAPVLREWFIPWQYSVTPSNYCWTLQSSSNLVDWADIPGACATDPLTVYATNASGFFRLRGTVFLR